MAKSDPAPELPETDPETGSTTSPETVPETGPETGKAYQVLARRFRPTSFEHVVGQEQVMGSLASCLDQDRLPHAFLFTGSRGVGKTTSARILARAVNCEQGASSHPCGTCEACLSILDGSASDVFELDAASNNSVDDVRALREQAGYAPLRLRRKVFILDEVHMFSKAAFNALLKILEEPPAHVLFILATTELHKVPDTVRSRCQVLPFRRIGEEDIAGRLAQIAEAEGITIDPEILQEISASCMGGMRDAETALERVLPLAEGLDIEAYRRLEGRLGLSQAAELVEACLNSDSQSALLYAAKAVETGVDERECMGEVLGLLRQVFLLQIDGKDTVLVEAAGEFRARLQALAELGDPVRIDAMMQLLILARDRIRHIDDRRILLELTLVRLSRVGEVVSLGELHAGRAAPAAAAPPRSAPTTPAARPWEKSSAPAATPTPAATPAAPAADPAPVSDDPLARCIESLRADKGLLATLLGRAQVRWQGSDLLELSFPALKGIQRKLIEKPDTLALLEQRLRGETGSKIQVQLLIDGTPLGAAPAGGDAQKDASGPAEQQADSGGKDVGGKDVGGKDVGGKDVGGKDVGGKDVGGKEVGGKTPQDDELPELGKQAQDLFRARLFDKEGEAPSAQ